jgi:TldD protein
MMPNLAVTPQPSGPAVDDMIAGMEKGIVMLGSFASTDFQAKNGTLFRGQAYEVKKGKKVARLINAGVLFSATELWKNVIAAGGPASVVHTAQTEAKGEPMQITMHTVSGVALALKNQALIDVTRKA